jgi:hypothetical protein
MKLDDQGVSIEQHLVLIAAMARAQPQDLLKPAGRSLHVLYDEHRLWADHGDSFCDGVLCAGLVLAWR